MLNIFVGYDNRESIVFHTFVQSVLQNTKNIFKITPLIKTVLESYIGNKKDGSNDFIYTRFLVPFLQNFEGWALYVDGDMICQKDLKDLFALIDDKYAVMVVKHNYVTKQKNKYLGNINENYPKKNWSSVILWNCGHPSNRLLTPELISSHDGKYLHRFEWLLDSQIGELPVEWNWLSVEYPKNPVASIIHYTLGAPCFKEYRNTDMADIWLNYYKDVNNGYDI
jgi:lipopolysaccharide biosynthesis glycosyltransferase